MIKVSIVIPAHNEENRIKKTLEEYGDFFKNLKKQKKLDFEILIVLNACKDNTLEVVKNFQKKIKEIRYLNFERGGKGFAIKEGFKDALQRNNDLVGFVDADNSTGPEAYYDLVKEIKNYGGIVASRYVQGSRVHPKQSIKRIIASRIFNAFIRAVLMINYRDTQCGAKLFKRAAIEGALPELKMSKWAFDVDLIYTVNKKGYKIKELATTWSDAEDSKIKFAKAGPMMAFAVMRLRILNSPFRWLIKLYDGIISKIAWKFFK